MRITTSTNQPSPVEERVLSEERIQADFFQHINGYYPQTRKCLFHVPNGGSRNEIEGNRFKAQGVVPGIQDIFFLWSNGTYIIEFKDATGQCSSEQKESHAAHAVQGFTTWIFRTSPLAVDFILAILLGHSLEPFLSYISPYSNPDLYPALKAEASYERQKRFKKN